MVRSNFLFLVLASMGVLLMRFRATTEVVSPSWPASVVVTPAPGLFQVRRSPPLPLRPEPHEGSFPMPMKLEGKEWEWWHALRADEAKWRESLEYIATREERREQWLTEIAREDFNCTIHALLYELHAFDIDPNAINRRTDDHARMIDSALAKPRIQKIMQVADHGSHSERAALARRIAAAVEDFLINMPLVSEEPTQQSLAVPYGMQFLALTLPALDDGTEHFELVARMHHLHQQALLSTRPAEFEGHVYGEADALLAHASNQYLRRLAERTLEPSSHNAEQIAVIEEYRALQAEDNLVGQIRQMTFQPRVLAFTSRYWTY